MKKSYCRLSWYMLILLVLTSPNGFRQATGQAEEQPAGKTSGSNQTPSIKPGGMSEMFKGTVVEVIDAGRHIYVHINTGEKLVWVAVPAFDGKPGDKVLVPPGIPVADFQSKNLNRKFKMIYFVGGIRRID
jgi:TOBE domain